MRLWHFQRRGLAALALFALTTFPNSVTTAAPQTTDAQSDRSSLREDFARDASNLQSFVKSQVARDFLAAVSQLPAFSGPRTIFRNGANRDAVTQAQAAEMPETTLAKYKRIDVDEQFYYHTFYGTPLAFVRALDILGLGGIETLDGARMADFGFGSVGQLRLMALCGANAHGVDIDPMLAALYSEPGDTGKTLHGRGIRGSEAGEVSIHVGSFPTDRSIVAALGGRLDAFVSKNTLKKGYIHPPADNKPMINLGVDDLAFLNAVHHQLKPGGLFLIYNLSPAPSADKYIPWSDGACPFTAEDIAAAGFEVLTLNRDDSHSARMMGRILGWDAQMDLDNNLFGMYTLLRRN